MLNIINEHRTKTNSYNKVFTEATQILTNTQAIPILKRRKMNDFPSELFHHFFCYTFFLLFSCVSGCWLLFDEVSFSSETVSTHEYQQLYSFFV